MKISILIPVFNEQATINKVLDQIYFVKLNAEKEVIVIDDGSIDKTKANILKWGKTHPKLKIKTIFHKNNQGKGAAVISGIKQATGDYLLIQDADLEYNPEDIPHLLAPILNSQLVAVFGSRFKKSDVSIPKLYLLGNKLLTWLTNILYSSKLTDMETGYKLIPRAFLQNINLDCNRFDIEPEITAKLLKNKISIIEVPISYKGRTHLAGKKLTVSDGVAAITALIRFRFAAC